MNVPQESYRLDANLNLILKLRICYLINIGIELETVRILFVLATMLRNKKGVNFCVKKATTLHVPTCSQLINKCVLSSSGSK